MRWPFQGLRDPDSLRGLLLTESFRFRVDSLGAARDAARMRTTAFPEPTSEELHEHLVGLFFGFKDLLSAAILAAYGDLARTLGGISGHPNADDLKKRAVSLLQGALPDGVASATAEETFDTWHEQTCQGLRDIYTGGHFSGFSYGHAQKWVNMLVKYSVLLEDRAVPGSRAFLPVAHMPLDSIILGVLSRDYGLQTTTCEPWSKISDYRVYMGLQAHIRARFKPSPLSAELRLWRPEADATPAEAKSGGRRRRVRPARTTEQTPQPELR